MSVLRLRVTNPLLRQRTMLGQVRALLLGLVTCWPAVGLWDLDPGTRWWAYVAATILLGWLHAGYRRGRFASWSWLPEGLAVLVVAAAGAYGFAAVLAYLWVGFRGLYGDLRDKVVASLVLAGVLGVGGTLFGSGLRSAVFMLVTALMTLVVAHVLATLSSSRDRSAERATAVATAGAGLAAAGTRAEAMEVTLGAALAMDPTAGGALIVTVAGPALHVVSAVGALGEETEGLVTRLAELPEPARAVLVRGGYALLDGDPAREVAAVLRLPDHAAVALAALAAREDVFGMLIVSFARRPVDDLTTPVTTLAGAAALTFDELLSRSRLSIVVDHSPDALILAGEGGTVRFVNPAGETMLGCPAAELVGRSLVSFVHPDDRDGLIDRAAPAEPTVPRACRIHGSDDAPWTDVEATVEFASEHDGSRSIVFNARDISERHRLEIELRHAQKLESVGRLASGIAHEINTPIQFVGDNVRFLETALADLTRLVEAYQGLAEHVRAGADPAGALARAEAIADDIDIDFVLEEAPSAISQSLEGIGRVAGIVRAMKAFGHPGTDQKARADLNEAIRNTLVVANNEIKYVADVEADLGDLPLVQCHLGDINQVVLNLVVNAAHAIRAADRGRGTIRVRTRAAEGWAVIDVADTGTGVAPDIADKLFDPFFTTKEVGTGTGQGLALVRTLVTDRHGGTIDFTSEWGTGTTFTVRLPLEDADAAACRPELVGALP